MELTVTKFGEYQNQDVMKYTMTNDHDVRVSILNLAGIWQEYSIPTADGHQNLLLSSDSVEGFMGNGLCLNKLIGRVANRIDHATFTIDQQTYHVEQNEGENNIHGGNNGWKENFWEVETKESADQLQVVLSKQFTEAMDHFPGTEMAKVTYTLANDNSLSIDFEGSSDQPTLFNPTNHTYWNISDHNDVTGLELQLNSTDHLAVNATKIPTGERIANAGTPYDFQRFSSLGQALSAMQATSDEGGFDDYFEVTPTDASTNQPVAQLYDPETKRRMKMYSDRNSVVIYTANGLSGDLGLSKPAQSWLAIAMEGQTLTDAINHDDFGNIVLRPEAPMHNHLRYEIEF